MKSHLVALMVVVLCLTLSACSGARKEPLRIGFNTWIGYQALRIAEEKGFFSRRGLNVSIREYGSLVEVMRAFEKREVDVMFSSVYEVLSLAAKGEAFKVVLVADYSDGADAVIVRNEIVEPADLKGKRIGVEIGSVSHFTVIKALQKGDLLEDEVVILNMSVEESEKEFFAGRIDAMGTWDPYLSRAVTAGKGRVLLSSRDFPGEIIDTAAIRNEVLQKKRKECKELVAAYLETLEWLKNHEEEGVAILAKALSTTSDDVKSQLKGVKLTGLAENISGFAKEGGEGSIFKATASFAQFLNSHKIISHMPEQERFVDPSLVRELAG